MEGASLKCKDFIVRKYLSVHNGTLLNLQCYINMDNIGHKRRLGLLGAKRTTITVHRSEEILPAEGGSGGVQSQLVRGTSVSSEGDLTNAELEQVVEGDG